MMTAQDGTQKEMPRYKCHKEVWALKIAEIEFFNSDGASMGASPEPLHGMQLGLAIITPVEENYAPFKVDAEYVRKHKPKVGGYYVVYADGYKSWSPAQAFEEGYTRI